MSSPPRKDFTNYTSPYAKPQQQTYPSQSEDYFSLTAGGPHGQEQEPRRFLPHFYRDTGGGGRGGVNQRYQNNRHNRNNFSGGRGNGNRWSHGANNRPKQQEPQTKQDVFNLYFHPSMLEDPWEALMGRLRALQTSEINLPQLKRKTTEVNCDNNG